MQTPAEFLEHLNIFTQMEWMEGDEQELRRRVSGADNIDDALKEYDEWVAVYGEKRTRVIIKCYDEDTLAMAFRDKLYDIITPWDDSSYEMARNAMDWLEYEMKEYDTDGFDPSVWEDDMSYSDSFAEQTDGEASIHYAILFEWLASNTTHQDYANEVTEEYGDLGEISKAIALGMIGMAREIYYGIIKAVREMFEEYYEEGCDE